MKVVLAVLLLGALGVVAYLALGHRRLPTNSEPTPEQRGRLEPESFEPGRFWERTATFSLLVFDGDQRQRVKELLQKVGYALVKEEPYQGSAWELNDKLFAQSDAGQSLLKAVWLVGNRTVLAEPEMALLDADEDHFVAFCAENKTKLVAATWERVSQSAWVVELDGSGRTKETYMLAGKPVEGGPQPAHDELVEAPNPEGLQKTLGSLGISLEEIFGQVEATVFSLKEST